LLVSVVCYTIQSIKLIETVRDFKLPPRCTRDRHSYRTLTWCRLVFCYRRFGTTFCSHFQGSRRSRRMLFNQTKLLYFSENAGEFQIYFWNFKMRHPCWR